MLEETELAHSSFLPFFPEAVYFGLELGKFLFFFLASYFGNFGKINQFPVANDFLLYVLVILTS